MASLLDLAEADIVDDAEEPDREPISTCPPPAALRPLVASARSDRERGGGLGISPLAKHAVFRGPWAVIPVAAISKPALEGIREELTLTPVQVVAGSRRATEVVVCYQLRGEDSAAQLLVPRAYFTERFGRPGQDETSIGTEVQDAVAFEGQLRDERQKAFVAKMVATLVERRTTIALGSAEPGCGKTVMFLYIWAVVLRRKCLVIVHGLPIVAQWIAAARRFCPKARVGIVHQDTWQVRDRDIVVASSDTIAARAEEYNEGLWREFGVVCFDEAHHIMASTFVSIYQRCMHARFCISLTGTPYRKDGLTHAMPFLTGPNAASMKNTDPVHVRCVEFGGGLQTRIEFKFGPGKGKPNEAAMISAMVEDEARTRLIAQAVRDAVVAGRKVLVLCDRNELREAIRLLVEEMLAALPCPQWRRPWRKAGVQGRGRDPVRKVMEIYDRIYLEPYRTTPTPGKERRMWMEQLAQATAKLGATEEECLAMMVPPQVVPELEPEDEDAPAAWIESLNAGDDYLSRMNKQQARAILATYVMAREALDIPGLNTLVLATPSSDVRQAIGRIRRTGAAGDHAAQSAATAPLLETRSALVVDLVDEFPPFVNWAMARQRYYTTERFAVSRAIVKTPADAWDANADRRDRGTKRSSDQQPIRKRNANQPLPRDAFEGTQRRPAATTSLAQWLVGAKR